MWNVHGLKKSGLDLVIDVKNKNAWEPKSNYHPCGPLYVQNVIKINEKNTKTP